MIAQQQTPESASNATTVRHYEVRCRRYNQNDRTIGDEAIGRGQWKPMTHREACTVKSKMPNRKGWHYYIAEIPNPAN